MAKLFPILIGDLAVLHATFCNEAFPPRRRGLVMLTAPAGQLMRPEVVQMQETEAEAWLRTQAHWDPSDVRRVLDAARAMEKYYMERARDARQEAAA